jgi:hypothetical protein
MHFLIGLIAALMIGVPAVVPLAARAQDSITGYDTVCTPHDAEFNTFAVTDDHKPDGTPYHEGRYPGENVHIFSCKLAGHYVRMNFRWLVNQLECGAAPRGRISVWIDGRKVVDDAPWNDYGACVTQSSNGHPSTQTLDRVIFNNRLNLTTCYTDYTYDEKIHDIREKSACVLKDLSGLTPDPKSIFYGPVKLTPDRLLLTIGDPVFCSPITRELNGRHPNDGHLATLSELGLPTDLSDDQRQKGWKQTFTADIDNDGVVDTVTYNGLGREYGSAFEHDFTWRSSATAGVRSVRDRWPEDSSQLNVDDPQFFRFVRVGSRIYAFDIDDNTYAIGGAEAESSNFDSSGNTHLVELHPDGRETEVCAWRPQDHPEEAL